MADREPRRLTARPPRPGRSPAPPPTGQMVCRRARLPTSPAVPRTPQWCSLRFEWRAVGLLEINGIQGRRPEVLRRLSDGARVHSAHRNLEGDSQLSYAVYGELVTALDGEDPENRNGGEPDALDDDLGDLLAEVATDNGSRGAAMLATIEARTVVYTDSDTGGVMNFSNGYPKIVRVSEISPRVDTDTYFEGEKMAVQLAPGVWTNLSEGAELQDAVADGGLIGLCASIKAFERKNPQISRGGTC
jgi:hypothetical protein